MMKQGEEGKTMNAHQAQKVPEGGRHMPFGVWHPNVLPDGPQGGTEGVARHGRWLLRGALC